jgi:hypothetical protein
LIIKTKYAYAIYNKFDWLYLNFIIIINKLKWMKTQIFLIKEITIIYIWPLNNIKNKNT